MQLCECTPIAACYITDSVQIHVGLYLRSHQHAAPAVKRKVAFKFHQKGKIWASANK